MADLPIPFSAPMVRANLREIEQPGSGKTQTRRVLDQSQFHPDCVEVCRYSDDDPTLIQRHGMDGSICGKVKVAYRPGDRLYVREHWRTVPGVDDLAPRDLVPYLLPIRYEADGTVTSETMGWGRFRQGMHMPKWASRITLIVTDVRVQRLREISADDALAEGVTDAESTKFTRVAQFKELWDSINGDRPGCAWRHNPWVAAYTFRPILGNVDALEAAAA